MTYTTLSNGIQMPIIGIGTNTFGKEGNVFKGDINHDTKELDTAITAGYRLLDTAIMYRNESVIGDAVKKSRVDRHEFFLTSKLPKDPEYTATDEAVHKGVTSSLKALQTEYIDLYLIHHPWDDMEGMVRVWKVLETYVDAGKIKSIGVSNFNEVQLQNILDHARINPVVNQIESHPGKWQHGLIEYCLAHDVVPEAWGPLSRLDDKQKETLDSIACKYNKTWAQLVLRYQLDLGMIVIPKSHNAIRQQQNLDVFDFVIKEEDRIALSKM